VATGDSNQTEPDTDSETVTITQNPAIDIDKSLSGNADQDSSGTVTAGDTLTYSFKVTNTGNVTLSNISVTDPLVGLSAVSCAGDNTPPQIVSLAPGSMVTCTATYTVTAANASAGQVVNTVTVSGTGPQEQSVSDSDTETVTVVVVQTVTRTQGFWSTHLSYSALQWGTVPAPDKLLCGVKNVAGTGELMGGFWSDVSKKTDKTKRSALDQARMQLIQQLLAAMLNHQAFGSGSASMISNAKAAYCGSNVPLILANKSALDVFNQSGDGQPFPPGVVPGPANPKGAEAAANKPFWDVLP
jgi:uncharacterized repeat protein (TIGR01451 family)